MSEELRTLRAYRAFIKARLECGCLMTEKDCGLHGPRDVADVMLVSCIFMSEHVRHYGTTVGLATKAKETGALEGVIALGVTPNWQTPSPHEERAQLLGASPPAPSTPELEEPVDTDAWTTLRRKLGVNRLLSEAECVHRIISDLEHVEQERDAALARASEAEKQLNRWRTNIRNVVLEGDRTPMDDKALRDRAYKAIDARVSEAARTSVPVWVPCKEQAPTEKDATQTPTGDCVIWGNQRGEWLDHWNALFSAAQYPPTHWRKLYLPPLPVETEEGWQADERFRQEFEVYAKSKLMDTVTVGLGPLKQYRTETAQAAWLAFVAALRSKKAQATT